MTSTTNTFLSKRLRRSGILIIVGLVVEGLSLVWNHPLSFVAFLGLANVLGVEMVQTAQFGFDVNKTAVNISFVIANPNSR